MGAHGWARSRALCKGRGGKMILLFVLEDVALYLGPHIPASRQL